MDRIVIVGRILEIIKIINHPLKNNLENKLEFFSNHELLQVLAYLETGKIKNINLFLKEKINEYKQIIGEVKILKNKNKLSILKNNEKQDIKKEDLDIQNTIFDF